MRHLCALGLLLAVAHLTSSLLLGAFNIKSFGDTKSSNATLMNIITKIVQRYDVVLIQEVRDSDLSVTKRLMEHVNKGSSQYSYIVSEPLGRSTYTERYLFLYKKDQVSVDKSYLYDDGCESCGTDAFMREPFVVMFSSKYTTVKNFALIPQHTSPESAVEELKALSDVVEDVRARWNTNNIVLLGDFNAGCSYVTGSEWQQIGIYTDKSFHWLIPHDVDTTVSDTNCPYDRIVVTGDVLKGVQQGTAGVYNYMKAMGLSQSMAIAVSDHFPVEVKLIA
ncbi:unnamed protein product [Ophioblennius macclurei]